MDDSRFDHLTRRLASRMTRRGLHGLTAATLALVGLGGLGLIHDADAKKKKKKKKKGSSAPPPVNYACSNLGTGCSNTAVCQCRFSKSNQQVCMNVFNPPNGTQFQFCQTQANCPAGQFCDIQFSVCASGCPV